MPRILATITIACLLAGAVISCKKHAPTEPATKCDTCSSDTTHHPCDTCNINQDSLQRVKDSLAHAFVWTEYSIPGESNLTGVWVFGPNEIYIVGNSMYEFDGTHFSNHPTDNDSTHIALGWSGNGIFAFSDREFWSVYAGQARYTTNGYDFRVYNHSGMNACWGTSSHDMFLVGKGGLILHYDGTTFTEMASGTTKDLRSVWGTSHNDVWACGSSSSAGTTVLLHYDGTTWSEDPISIQKGGNGCGGYDVVWACDSAGHKFVATSGAFLIRKTDQGLWRSDSGLISNNLGGNDFIGIAPAGNSPNDMMAHGPWGFISHWNGKDWHQYKELFNYGLPTYYTSAFSINGNTACAVGGKNGPSWVAIGRRAP